MCIIFEIDQQLQNKNTNLVGPAAFEPAPALPLSYGPANI